MNILISCLFAYFVPFVFFILLFPSALEKSVVVVVVTHFLNEELELERLCVKSITNFIQTIFHQITHFCNSCIWSCVQLYG